MCDQHRRAASLFAPEVLPQAHQLRSDVLLPQASSLHSSVISAALSLETQAAMFPEDKEHLWEDTGNLTVSQVEEALLRRAQSPTFAQHIILKPYDLSKEMLQDIANKPHAIIISADGSPSAVCSSFAATQIPQAEQVT